MATLIPFVRKASKHRRPKINNRQRNDCALVELETINDCEFVLFSNLVHPTYSAAVRPGRRILFRRADQQTYSGVVLRVGNTCNTNYAFSLALRPPLARLPMNQLMMSAQQQPLPTQTPPTTTAVPPPQRRSWQRLAANPRMHPLANVAAIGPNRTAVNETWLQTLDFGNVRDVTVRLAENILDDEQIGELFADQTVALPANLARLRVVPELRKAVDDIVGCVVRLGGCSRRSVFEVLLARSHHEGLWHYATNNRVRLPRRVR